MRCAVIFWSTRILLAHYLLSGFLYYLHNCVFTSIFSILNCRNDSFQTKLINMDDSAV